MLDPVIDVAVGIVTNADRQVLIAKRLEGTHYAGFWEFPGGKCEPGESMEQALTRELQEEVAITPLTSQLFYTVEYSYPEKTVKLHCYIVKKYQGSVRGAEGQSIQWLPYDQLHTVDLPPANYGIVDKLQQRLTVFN